MSFRDKASQGAVESRENSGSDGGDGGSRENYGIDVDFDETAFVRMSPTTFVTGNFPAEEEGNPIIRFRNAEYNEGRQDQGYLGLVFDDPEAIVDEDEGTDGTVILETDDTDSTDYRVFNTDDGETSLVDGVGVKVGGGGSSRLYEGEIVEEFDEDRIVLTVSGASSKNVAKRLDKKGALAADMDDNGNVNGGLIEYKPYDLREDDGNEVTSRYARDPELKTSLHGQRVGIFLGRREELDDEDTGYVGMDTDDDEVGGGEHNDPDQASFRERVEQGERRSMYWYVVFDVDAEEEVEEEVTDDEIYGYTYLHDDWGRFDPEAGRLPDDQWAFVEEYVENAEAGEVGTDEDVIRSNIEDNADAFEDEPQTENIVDAISNQV